ncbi:DNA-binding transcriptional regulator, FadR family [Mucilaginibacter pineti]|uniref:DNA-binding transcriptional regulator, FadR family n=1 Tax=Mucilaginibacter pineti TaxID=1391627 RepID=A0A1G7LQD5_9SPHI|nr:FCD domain-containing protein [Mucilaginibacter pineti]SDF51179.1 DNA-binding transcriptional regulator, FadR family [Mucilaginibacter pineti]
MNNNGLIKNIKNVDTSSLVDRVEKNLIEFFIEKNFKVGDSIPKELELSVSLGVSRTVIREALLRLRLMGLIDSRKKRGAVLTSPDLVSVLEKSMNPQILDTVTLKEIFEMRLALEIGIADFIIERITPQDIAELRSIVAVEPAKAEAAIFDVEQEIKFHGKLYDITGNETLRKFQKLLLPVFDYVHQSGLLKKPVKLKKFVSHAGLIDLMEKGSAEMLRNGMRNHLENHFARLFE